MSPLRALFVSTIVSLWATWPASGHTLEDPAPASLGCARLMNLKIPATNLLSATRVGATPEAPEYCRVLGYVRPAINFEIHLPTREWNNKFYMVGCGGACGGLEAREQVAGMARGLRRNYAVATTDGGHWGASQLDARFAYANPVARTDFAFRAVNATARVSKAVISAFYGRDIHKSYFEGCST